MCHTRTYINMCNYGDLSYHSYLPTVKPPDVPSCVVCGVVDSPVEAFGTIESAIFVCGLDDVSLPLVLVCMRVKGSRASK